MVAYSSATVSLSGVTLQDGGGYHPCMRCIMYGSVIIPVIDIHESADVDIHHTVVRPNIGLGIKTRSGSFTNNVVFLTSAGFWAGDCSLFTLYCLLLTTDY